MAEQLGDAHLLGAVVLHQQTLAARLGVFLDARQGGFDTLGRGRLGDEREGAARQAVLAVLVERDDLHRDVPRERVLLELAEHVPPQHVGQEDVERDRGRLILLGEIEASRRASRQHLEALVAGEVDHDPGIVRIVLHDQQDRVAGLDLEAVVRNCSIGRSGAGDRMLVGRRRPEAAIALGDKGPTYLSGR